MIICECLLVAIIILDLVAQDAFNLIIAVHEMTSNGATVPAFFRIGFAFGKELLEDCSTLVGSLGLAQGTAFSATAVAGRGRHGRRDLSDVVEELPLLGGRKALEGMSACPSHVIANNRKMRRENYP